MFTKIQASVGLIFHSAEEKRVFEIAVFITFHCNFKLVSDLIVGIKGNSEASSPFILISPLSDFNFILLSHNSSILISLS